MQTLQSQTARTIIYLFCIGGLLALHSLFIMVLWNSFLINYGKNVPTLTFLEGAGITSFAYVIVIAYRYGRKSVPSASEPSDTYRQTTSHTRHTTQLVTTSIQFEATKACAKLSPEQRERLRQELVEKCGCDASTDYASSDTPKTSS